MADVSAIDVATEFFTGVKPIAYEGPDTDNTLAYRFYDKDRLVLGKRMEEHLRLATCYWHSFCWDGFDVFGDGTFNRPWHNVDGRAAADAKMDVAFEFFSKLGTPYYCFHDVDVSAASDTPAELAENFAYAVDGLERHMADAGLKLLWGTQPLQPSALHGRRRDQPGPGRVRRCSRASAPRSGRHPEAGR